MSWDTPMTTFVRYLPRNHHKPTDKQKIGEYNGIKQKCLVEEKLLRSCGSWGLFILSKEGEIVKSRVILKRYLRSKCCGCAWGGWLGLRCSAC
jgi:hypothetical protein